MNNKTLLIATLLLFFACAGKDGPELVPIITDFAISGYILDACEEELFLEEATIGLVGEGWSCNDQTDEDGYFLIDENSCGDLRGYSDFNDLSGTSVDITVSKYDYNNYNEIKYWVEANFEFEMELKPADNPNCEDLCRCDPGYECINRICVEMCPPRYFRNKKGECEKIPPFEIVPDPIPQDETLEISIKLGENLLINDILSDGESCLSDEGYCEWYDKDQELFLPVSPIERELIIKYTINGSSENQTIIWQDSDIRNKSGLQINWDGKQFVANWK